MMGMMGMGVHGDDGDGCAWGCVGGGDTHYDERVVVGTSQHHT